MERAVTTGAEILVRGLVTHGVDTVFGIPGTHNLELYRHLGRLGVRHVTPRHEQGAGYAADGYARTTGRVGVVVTTTGPAVLNAAAAVGQAFSDSIPILVVAPGRPLRQRSREAGALHEMRDQLGAMAAITPFAYRVASHDELAETVSQAFLAMTSGRPRPAYLEIPIDLMDADDGSVADDQVWAPVRVLPAPPQRDLMAAAARRLAGASRPGLLLGGGARAAAAAAREVTEALAAPTLTTTNGKGILPEDHPLSVTASLHLPAARQALEECDVVLAVGTEFAETDWWNGLPRLECVVRVDLDAAQLTVRVRAAVAIHADAGAALTELAAALRTLAATLSEHGLARAERWRRQARAQSQVEGARWLSTMDAIAGVLNRDAIVVADNAMAGYYGALGLLPAYTPGGFCFPTGFGTLGYAVPAAIGAAVGSPHRSVVALVGDGGLMFSVAELATAVAHGIRLPVVVFDNGGYGEIRAQMRRADIEPMAVDLPRPDLVALARALGGEGVECGGPDELAAGLRAALNQPGPTVLVVPEDVPEPGTA
jgi:thiamine pyrophosphate-dependent acetolactate synthase large subunit-like protein